MPGAWHCAPVLWVPWRGAAPERLSASDVQFLYLEDESTPAQLGSVSVFDAPAAGGPFDHDALVSLIEQRISLVPRYRQVVRGVPGGVANPVWVDDADFDVGYHVRRSALPRPGTTAQLLELAARVLSRRLDRDRPLWELYFVEGLASGGFATISKAHQALVDGVSVVDLQTVLLDSSEEPSPVPAGVWQPGPPPGPLGLLGDALVEVATSPRAAVGAIGGGLSGARSAAGRVARVSRDVAAFVSSTARPAPGSPLAAAPSGQRRLATLATSLEDHRRVRAAHGGTVNDVVLAVVTGALRAWLLTRGEPVHGRTTLRAAVPLSVHGGEDLSAARTVRPFLVDLPVGEPSPAVRLHQVGYAMAAHAASGRAVQAGTQTRLSGFAPPTVHALGARVTSGLTRRASNLVVTNVPGPQHPLYAAGARLRETYPLVPLAGGHAVSVGLTSYDGSVFYGLLADRVAVPDVDVLAESLATALEELLASAS